MIKQKRIILVLFMVLFTLTLISCKKSPTEPLVIELTANATTGYHWEYKTSGNDIFEVKGEYLQNDNPQGIVGVGGKQVYTITPLKEGTADIRFEYLAPGTNEVAQYAEYSFAIDSDLNIKETSHRGSYFENE